MTLIKRTSRDLFLSTAPMFDVRALVMVWRNYHYPVMLSEARDALTLTTGGILASDWSGVLSGAFLLVSV